MNKSETCAVDTVYGVTMTDSTTAIIDCDSEEGVTIGLIDAIITAAHVLRGRDLTSSGVQEAIMDLRSNWLVRSLMGIEERITTTIAGINSNVDRPHPLDPVVVSDNHKE